MPRGMLRVGWGDKLILGGVTSPPPTRCAAVSCELGGTAAFEVQLRHRTQHWSSHWSDWSTSIFVPEGECDARRDPTALHPTGTRPV